MAALAIDPGGTIGWVKAGLLPEPALLEILSWGEADYHQGFLDDVWAEMKDGRIDFLIVENFVNRPGIRSWQPDALHQIGALQWMAGKCGVPFVLQTVGDAMSFSTPDKVAPFRQAGVGRGGKGHAVMALKHAIRWRWIQYYG